MLIYLILVGLVGAALGSFSLVLAWRMHDKKDWVSGRSKCDNCHKVLEPKDMIPIISWFVLRGKCRKCHKPIPKQVVGAEVLMALAFLGTWFFWPYAVSSLVGYLLIGIWIFILVILSALFWYDYRWFLLPNKLVYPLIGLSILFAVTRGFVVDFSAWTVIYQPVLSAVFLSGLFYAMYLISKGKWIGFGDVRIAIALGLIIGTPLQTWLMLFFASCIGVVIALPGLLSGNRKISSKVPFGPLLIVATVIVVLWGTKMIDLYTDFIGL
jgi:prepilin signal peptidase PulO-like enzyme (type II secretory pathway)